MKAEQVQTVHVVCACDDAYALPTAVMLFSMVECADPRRRFHVSVIDHGISEQSRSRMEAVTGQNVALSWVKPDDLLPRIEPQWGHVSPVTYDRIFVDRLADQCQSKLLWLDSDLLIVGDIGALYEQDMGEEVCLAVQDPFISVVSSPFGVQAWQAEGLVAGAAYLNAGVLLIDPLRWREARVADRALQYLEGYGAAVIFHDQEALNVALSGLWRPLEDCWNWMANPFHNRNQTLNGPAPVVVHFSGATKPWQQTGMGGWQQQYFLSLDQTGWQGHRPESRFTNRLIGWYLNSPLRRLTWPLENLRLRLRHSWGKKTS